METTPRPPIYGTDSADEAEALVEDCLPGLPEDLRTVFVEKRDCLLRGGVVQARSDRRRGVFYRLRYREHLPDGTRRHRSLALGNDARMSECVTAMLTCLREVSRRKTREAIEQASRTRELRRCFITTLGVGRRVRRRARHDFDTALRTGGPYAAQAVVNNRFFYEHMSLAGRCGRRFRG